MGLRTNLRTVARIDRDPDGNVTSEARVYADTAQCPAWVGDALFGASLPESVRVTYLDGSSTSYAGLD